LKKEFDFQIALFVCIEERNGTLESEHHPNKQVIPTVEKRVSLKV
jgi:hypothetical protein